MRACVHLGSRPVRLDGILRYILVYFIFLAIFCRLTFQSLRSNRNNFLLGQHVLQNREQAELSSNLSWRRYVRISIFTIFYMLDFTGFFTR